MPGISSSEDMSAQMSGNGCPEASIDSASVGRVDTVSLRREENRDPDQGNARLTTAIIRRIVRANVRCVIPDYVRRLTEIVSGLTETQRPQG